MLWLVHTINSDRVIITVIKRVIISIQMYIANTAKIMITDIAQYINRKKSKTIQ